MPHYLDATIARSANRSEFIVHVWAGGSLVCSAPAGSVPHGIGVDLDQAADGQMNDTLQAMGFRVVGSCDQMGKRVVIRANSRHTFWDTRTRGWC